MEDPNKRHFSDYTHATAINTIPEEVEEGHNLKFVSRFISKRIKELRRQNKFTQEDLAQLVGLTRTSIVNIEAGNQKVTSENIWLIACAFQVGVSDLFPLPMQVTVTEEEVKVVKVKFKKKFSI